MSIFNGPPRAGARGGRDQFNWDNVKSDKDREFYLGHSVKAATGRWQKGKDLFWYTRDKQDEARAEEELAAVKAREQELMMEALGLKPKTQRSTTEAQLDQQELNRLLQRGGNGEEPAGGSGLGFAAGKGAAAMGGPVHEVMGGEGLAPPQGLPPPPPGGSSHAPKRSAAELEEQIRLQEKAAKRARKEAKKAKKEAKESSHKHKKHKKHKSRRD